MNFWDEKEVKRFFEELPFYNVSIEKLYIKRLNNIDMLRERPFYNELIIAKISKAIRGYARSYGSEIKDSKEPSIQLAISNPNIEDLFKD